MAMSSSERSKALDGYVRKLTAMTAKDDAHDVYEAWAKDYESDLVEGYGYNAHRTAAAVMAEVCQDRHARILDLGCGTGLVAEALRVQGFDNIDGFDASANMLEQARSKGIYQEIIQGDVRADGVLAPETYDAAIAVGVFGGGHVGPDDLECFIRPVREGGAVVLYANGIPFVEDDYASHLRRIEAAGLCEVLRIDETNYMDRIERPGYLVLARRTKG